MMPSSVGNPAGGHKERVITNRRLTLLAARTEPHWLCLAPRVIGRHSPRRNLLTMTSAWTLGSYTVQTTAMCFMKDVGQLQQPLIFGRGCG
jgi:hypothetical protein